MGTWEWNIQTNETFWSEQLEPIHGLPPGGFDGTFDGFLKAVHPDDREHVTSAIQAAVEGADNYEIEFRVIYPDGSIHWVGGRGKVFRDDQGRPEVMIGIGMDITQEKQLLEAERTAREQAERAGKRLEFLAQASELVAGSLNYRKTLERITRLAVPNLADWCGIDMIRADGTSEWVSGVHVDPNKDDLIRVLRTKYPIDLTTESMREIIETQRGQLYPEIPDELLRETTKDEEHYRLISEIGIVSAMVVPLTARDRVIGLLSLLTSEESGRVYTDADLSLAMEIARRCAIAVENARLYEERSYIARTLQRALLPPELPVVPGLDIATRFLPAGEGNDVGGDFYDLFQTAGGRWGVAIGDVCGKGAGAATLTGLARHTIRAAALRDPEPTAVVEVLNQAVLRQSKDTEFVTAAYGDLVVAKGSAEIRLTLAGHPEPVLLRADGTTELAGNQGVLLGVLDSLDAEATAVTLRSGDSLILYTDGVIEAQKDGEVLGRKRLAEAVKGLQERSAADIADAVEQIATGFGEAPRDDIALLVLKVTG